MNTVIIPQQNSLIAQWRNKKLEVVRKTGIPYHSNSVITDNGLIATVCFPSGRKQKTLRILDGTRNLLARHQRKRCTCIATKENVVYMGGMRTKSSGELFSFIDILDLTLSDREVGLPIRSVTGKSIDDILIRGDSLILVGHNASPKYLFEFDISERANPRHVCTRNLYAGHYKHIIKGDINDGWIVLLSSNVGMAEAFNQVSLLEGDNLITCDDFTINFPIGWCSDESETVFDICLLDEHLVILTEKRLCRLNLGHEHVSKKNLETILINDKNHPMSRLVRLDGNHCLLANPSSYQILEIPSMPTVEFTHGDKVTASKGRARMRSSVMALRGLEEPLMVESVLPLRQQPGAIKNKTNMAEITNAEEAMAAVKEKAMALKDVPENLKTAEICLEAVKQNSRAFVYVPENRRTAELHLEVVRQNAKALIHVPANLITVEFCIEAIKRNPGVLAYIPQKLKTREIYLEAVKQDGNIISSVPMVFRTEEMYIATVSRDGRMLKHVPEKSKTGKICNMAARNTRYYDFKYVLEQIPEELRTAELYLEAVKNDGDALKYVSEELKAKVKRGGT